MPKSKSKKSSNTSTDSKSLNNVDMYNIILILQDYMIWAQKSVTKIRNSVKIIDFFADILNKEWFFDKFEEKKADKKDK